MGGGDWTGGSIWTHEFVAEEQRGGENVKICLSCSDQVSIVYIALLCNTDCFNSHSLFTTELIIHYSNMNIDHI